MITSFKHGRVKADFGKAVERLKEIELDWQTNFFEFEFEFTVLNYTLIEKNQYKYRLEGFDDKWYNSGTRRFARYTPLLGGTYTLRIIASNNDGIWNNQGAVLKIKVIPPPWKTWWAYSLYVLAFWATVSIHMLTHRNKLKQQKKLRIRNAKQQSWNLKQQSNR